MWPDGLLAYHCPFSLAPSIALTFPCSRSLFVKWLNRLSEPDQEVGTHLYARCGACLYKYAGFPPVHSSFASCQQHCEGIYLHDKSGGFVGLHHSSGGFGLLLDEAAILSWLVLFLLVLFSFSLPCFILFYCELLVPTWLGESDRLPVCCAG